MLPSQTIPLHQVVQQISNLMCMYQHTIPAYPISKCISNSAPKFSHERNWRKIPMSSAGLFGLLLMNVSKASFMAFTNFSFLRKQTSIIWSTLSLKSRSSWTMVLSFSGLITIVLPNACKIKHIFQLAWIFNLNDKNSKILSHLYNVLFLVLILVPVTTKVLFYYVLLYYEVFTT